MKKLDRLILFEIFPVFFISFVISVFVLMMQFMFLYIDDIAGKGVGFLTILEMIFYLSMTFVPMALPISVLISSVMVYGALGERYELATAKSAGISFQRMMYPAAVFAFFVSIASFLCSEYIIPVANVKTRSRLYDISKKKPTLNIKEGVFNTAFDGYGIRISEKSEDGSKIKDVILYDYNSQYQGTANMIIAKDGEMVITPDQKFFMLILNDGHQYQEVKRYNRSGATQEPFMVTKFDRFQKVFDLSDFELKNTNENYFKNHQKTMNVRELVSSIDSTENRMQLTKDRIELEMSYDLPFIESRLLKEREKDKDTSSLSDEVKELDSTQTTTDVNMKKEEVSPQKSESKTLNDYQKNWATLTPDLLKTLPKDSLLIETIPYDETVDLIASLRSNVQSAKDQLGYRAKQLSSDKIKIVKSTYELHYKFVLAFSCLVFVLIGGAMGSIVRKGGFGYSLLISIIFYISFLMMSIMFRKSSESFRIDPIIGAYLPLMILLPMGLFLVYKAINDSKLSLDFTKINRWFNQLKKRKKIIAPEQS